MGPTVGVGDGVGVRDGVGVGVGLGVGMGVGDPEGAGDGVGQVLGEGVGVVVLGVGVGLVVAELVAVGEPVGVAVADSVGVAVGDWVGVAVGDWVGLAVGLAESDEGLVEADGELVGLALVEPLGRAERVGLALPDGVAEALVDTCGLALPLAVLLGVALIVVPARIGPEGVAEVVTLTAVTGLLPANSGARAPLSKASFHPYTETRYSEEKL